MIAPAVNLKHRLNLWRAPLPAKSRSARRARHSSSGARMAPRVGARQSPPGRTWCGSGPRRITSMRRLRLRGVRSQPSASAASANWSRAEPASTNGWLRSPTAAPLSWPHPRSGGNHSVLGEASALAESFQRRIVIARWRDRDEAGANRRQYFEDKMFGGPYVCIPFEAGSIALASRDARASAATAEAIVERLAPFAAAWMLEREAARRTRLGGEGGARVVAGDRRGARPDRARPARRSGAVAGGGKNRARRPARCGALDLQAGRGRTAPQ